MIFFNKNHLFIACWNWINSFNLVSELSGKMFIREGNYFTEELWMLLRDSDSLANSFSKI